MKAAGTAKIIVSIPRAASFAAELDSARFSSEEVLEVAKRMGADPDVPWAQENDPVIEIHSWQTHPRA